MVVMPFTIPKLQARLRELRQAVEEPGIAVTPLASTPASAPMAPPPEDDALWQDLNIGQVWGQTHGTCWLQAFLTPWTYVPEQTPVLQLHWEQEPVDHLL